MMDHMLIMYDVGMIPDLTTLIYRQNSNNHFDSTSSELILTGNDHVIIPAMLNSLSLPH